MLLRALSFLPSGYTFLVFDAWRPYTVQKSLYDEYFEKLRRDEPQLDDAELHRRARAFVSYPDQAKRFAFVHSSGGAIDLTLVDENGSKLDMGTDFDDFTPPRLYRRAGGYKRGSDQAKQTLALFCDDGGGLHQFPE